MDTATIAAPSGALEQTPQPPAIPPKAGHALAKSHSPASSHLRECHDCGCLQTIPPIAPGMVARCLRCAAVLRRGRRDPLTPTLALAVTGLILLAIATELPFMQLRLLGRSSATHFTSGAAALDDYGMWGLGFVVLATTVFAPFAKLICTIAVLVGLRLHQPPRRLYLVFRAVDLLRPWSMIEVYMLGIFVAYTKLVDMAQIEVGIAAYALAGLMFIMVAADAALDPDAVWENLERRGLVADPTALIQSSDHANPAPNPSGPARAPQYLIGCTCCGLVRQAAAGDRCPRCGEKLHPRKPDSIRRTTALVLAAAIFYIPANVYPVMTLISLGRGSTNTILSGVKELAASGMWPLALLVFFASITVPVMKIIGLTTMLLSVRRRATGHLRDRSRLYRIVDSVGRWSMIDVFMISILVGLVHLGFIANVEPGIGAMAFATVVILTMLAAMSFDPRLMWDAAGRNPDHRSADRHP